MTDEEKARYKELIRLQQEGYRIMEEERTQRIRSTRFADVCHLYDDAFEISRRKPLRTTTGPQEWYRILLQTDQEEDST